MIVVKTRMGNSAYHTPPIDRTVRFNERVGFTRNVVIDVTNFDSQKLPHCVFEHRLIVKCDEAHLRLKLMAPTFNFAEERDIISDAPVVFEPTILALP